MDKKFQGHKVWWKGYKDSCDVNYTGSSPAMEATGALRTRQQSVERLKLRYTPMIADSDAKTAKHFSDHKPYGEGVKIVKHECVVHAQKRLGTQLRTLKSPGRQTREGGLFSTEEGDV